MKRVTRHKLPGMACPHCDTVSTQKFGRALSPLVREVMYRCDNDACGHGFIAQINVIRTTIQSAHPNPDIHLPFAPLPRKTIAANDDAPLGHPPAANENLDTMTG